MILLAVVAAVLAFAAAGLLSHSMPLAACMVAWACGVASAVLVVCALFDWAQREDYARWQRTGKPW